MYLWKHVNWVDRVRLLLWVIVSLVYIHIYN